MQERTRTWLARALFIVGLVPLVFIAVLGIRSCTLERESRSAGRPSSGHQPVGSAVATRAQAAATGRVGHLEIARLGLRAAIVEGIDSDELLVGVGHVPGTAFPGEPDNSALAGHRDTHLASLQHIARGDRIRVATPDGVFAYAVDSFFVVTPDRGDLLRPTGRPMLTLVTCYPFHWIGSAPKRFIVQAHEVRENAEASASEGSMHGGARPSVPRAPRAVDKRHSRRHIALRSPARSTRARSRRARAAGGIGRAGSLHGSSPEKEVIHWTVVGCVRWRWRPRRDLPVP